MDYTPLELSEFTETVWDYYRTNGRNLPWREPETDGTFDPYKILVSEIMLQQTQVQRVLPKYHEFLTVYPTITVLADAPLSTVLKLWSGLGYNRRAKYLHQIAQVATTRFGGTLPATMTDLTELPGIGINTAGAIMTYAYNQPVIFLETNIRTVYIYHFFPNKDAVHDKELLEIVTHTLDTEHPREFCWALMDYGAWLKKASGNAGRRSHGYKKQSSFVGSRRQIRGQVLRLLIDQPLTQSMIKQAIADERLITVLADLEKEQLITKIAGRYNLAN